jgi:hypothetical protein
MVHGMPDGLSELKLRYYYAWLILRDPSSPNELLRCLIPNTALHVSFSPHLAIMLFVSNSNDSWMYSFTRHLHVAIVVGNGNRAQHSLVRAISIGIGWGDKLPSCFFSPSASR